MLVALGHKGPRWHVAAVSWAAMLESTRSLMRTKLSARKITLLLFRFTDFKNYLDSAFVFLLFKKGEIKYSFIFVSRDIKIGCVIYTYFHQTAFS
jgi:hypothetical protein